MKKNQKMIFFGKLLLSFILFSLFLTSIFAILKMPLLYKIVVPLLTTFLFTYFLIKIFEKELKIKISKKIEIILTIILILGAYIIFPDHHAIRFENTKGLPIDAILKIEGDSEMVLSGTNISFWLPKGNQEFEYLADYRKEKTEQSKINILYPKFKKKIIRLEPANFNFEKTSFLEPYEKIELKPRLIIKGEDIDENKIDRIINKNDDVPFGKYQIKIETQFFKKDITLMPEEETNIAKIKLEPNKNTHKFSEEEINWIKNYLRDYLELSAQKIIPAKYAGYPKQMHFFIRNITLSLGDMLFLICQDYQTENKKMMKKEYFT